MPESFEKWSRQAEALEEEYTPEEAGARLKEIVEPWLKRRFSNEEAERLLRMVKSYRNYHVIESLVALTETGGDPEIIHEGLHRFKEALADESSLKGKEYLAEMRQRGLIAQWFRGSPLINVTSQLKWEKERRRTGKAA